jgi:ABC-2 type transport system ATP-binding protein
MLEAQGLTKWYHGIRAVSDVSFTIGAGEVLGYLGPNGSGKTTTVGMLTGLLEPGAGRVLFMGRPISDDPVGYRRHLGYVPEVPHLYQFLSAREHLEMVCALREMEERTSGARIAALLDVLGLESKADAPMSSCSKGMKQKVLIAAALVHDPPLLIFDEPMSGLDVMSALVFRHLLGELASAGKAVLHSSHDLDAVEKSCSRVLVLHRGRVIAHDSVSNLRQALSEESLEGVFEQLVQEFDPAQRARDLLGAMGLGAR